MARYLARNAGAERRYSFLDGPITANNPMGVHHAWGRTYKDLYQRYHTALGRAAALPERLRRQGLWIEVEVESELGFNNKRQIEEFGDRPLRGALQGAGRPLRGDPDGPEQAARYWMDWDHSYFTNSDENNYTIWAFLEKCHRSGLVYKGHDVMPWCPRCGTGLSNMEIATEGYRELRHLSVTIRLPVTTPGHEDEDLLVWTTTPWTLSSNVAAAVHPGLTYELVEGGDGRRWWISAGSRHRVAGDAAVVRSRAGLRARGPGVSGAVRRAAGAGGRGAPGDRLGRGLRRGGDRDRPHRTWVRPGGLRPGEGQWACRPGSHRRVRRLPRGLRLADRPVRGSRGGSVAGPRR